MGVFANDVGRINSGRPGGGCAGVTCHVYPVMILVPLGGRHFMGNSFAAYMARSKLLTLVTLVLMTAPFVYAPWYLAGPISIGVWFGSIIIRGLFMVKSSNLQ
jgi:hypothetical protein